jgi:hypothetical protein
MKTTPTEENDVPTKRILRVHEVLFALNGAFAAAYALLISSFSYRLDGNEVVSATVLKYFFLRNAVRINSLAHLNTDSSIGRELTLGLSLLAMALLILALAQAVSGTAIYRVVLNPIAGLTSLFAAPSALLLPILFGHMASRAELGASWVAPAKTALGSVLIVEILAACVLLAISGRWRPSSWTIGVLLILHFGIWILMVCTAAYEYHVLSPVLCFASVAFPCSGLAWCLYLRSLDARPVDTAYDGRTYVLGFGLLSVVVLLFLWLPPRGYSIAHPKDIRTVTITMVRTGCFGHCPVYTLVIHGTGVVEYSGSHHVSVTGKQVATIQSAEFSGLLEKIDRIHFFALEDRAFEKCSDTPEVTISISIDGKEKSVTSNTFCRGANMGPQAEFVRIAREVDSAVGSDQWIRCDHMCSP